MNFLHREACLHIKVIHCSNFQLDLALEKAFKTDDAFKEVNGFAVIPSF